MDRKDEKRMYLILMWVQLLMIDISFLKNYLLVSGTVWHLAFLKLSVWGFFFKKIQIHFRAKLVRNKYQHIFSTMYNISPFSILPCFSFSLSPKYFFWSDNNKIIFPKKCQTSYIALTKPVPFYCFFSTLLC